MHHHLMQQHLFDLEKFHQINCAQYQWQTMRNFYKNRSFTFGVFLVDVPFLSHDDVELAVINFGLKLEIGPISVFFEQCSCAVAVHGEAFSTVQLLRFSPLCRIRQLLWERHDEAHCLL